MVADSKKHAATGGWGYAQFDRNGKLGPQGSSQKMLSLPPADPRTRLRLHPLLTAVAPPWGIAKVSEKGTKSVVDMGRGRSSISAHLVSQIHRRCESAQCDVHLCPAGPSTTALILRPLRIRHINERLLLNQPGFASSRNVCFPKSVIYGFHERTEFENHQRDKASVFRSPITTQFPKSRRGHE